MTNNSENDEVPTGNKTLEMLVPLGCDLCGEEDAVAVTVDLDGKTIAICQRCIDEERASAERGK